MTSHPVDHPTSLRQFVYSLLHGPAHLLMLQCLDGSTLVSGLIALFFFVLPVLLNVPTIKMIEGRIANGPVQIGFDVSRRGPLLSTIPEITKHRLDNILCDPIPDVIRGKRTKGIGINPEEMLKGIVISASDSPNQIVISFLSRLVRHSKTGAAKGAVNFLLL